ncbi:MAG TPA: MaoC family dehydratase [Pseudorhodoferax sp.]|nr:MaoC family dehydratase [Pseudorhodoferax sp.]
MANAPSLYLDDLRVGDRFTSAEHALDAAQIQAFAAQFDPQPFHTDEAAAQRTLFKGLAASGWHTAAITMRLLVDSGLPLADGIIGSGGELHWPQPTRPDDRLHVESEVLEIVPSRSKPGRAMVQVRCRTLNQRGELLQSFSPRLVVAQRPNQVPPT